MGKGEYKIIVCHSLEEASRIFKVALEMKKKIAMPISYREFVEGRYYGKNIEAFLIDNVDQLIVYMAKGVTVEAITISHH